MRKKIIIILSAVMLAIPNTQIKAQLAESKPAAGTHTTTGGKEHGSGSSNKCSSTKPTSDSKPHKSTSNGSKGSSSQSSGSGSGSGTAKDGSGLTTKDRLEVSEETSRGKEQSSSSSSSKTVIDSYNWYFTNDGKLIPGLTNDWIKKNDMKTTQNVSVTYYHAGHYKGIRHPNTHIETTVTTTTYEEVEYEYKDPAGNTVTGTRTEATGSSSSTTSTPSKEDTSIKYTEEWDVPITGCDIGEKCEAITVHTPVPKVQESEYDFDMEMTN